MSDQNHNEPIGDPTPVQTVPECGILGQIVTFIAAPVIGLAVVAHFCMPARARGASYSAKLKWQERQAEVDCAIAAQSGGDTLAARSDASVAPSK